VVFPPALWRRGGGSRHAKRRSIGNKDIEMANQNQDTSNRGFASMDEEKQREIASKGGQSVPDEKRSFSKDPELAAEAGRKGGQESGGNFKNDPERASEAGRKGGQESGGNFANDRERAAEAGKKGGESRGS